MKKSMLFAAAAVVAMVGCTNEDFTGVQEAPNGSNVIALGSQKKAVTRADLTGADAAAALNNNFIVEGYKCAGQDKGDYPGSPVEVFKYYNVNYYANTAHQTESNSSDWEYVGQDVITPANVFATVPSGFTAIPAQTIKYWDFDLDRYDFVAFSQGKGVADASGNVTYAKFSTVDNTKIGAAVKDDGTEAVYTVTGTVKELGSAYIADLVTTFKEDYKTTVVTPKFRRLASKVRLAIYETVPGYSVKDVRFYTDATTTKVATTDYSALSDVPTLFAKNAVIPNGNGVMSVYYPTVGKDSKDADATKDDYNKAHIVFKAGSGTDDLTKNINFQKLVYTSKEEGGYEQGAGNIFLGRSSATATYAGVKDGTDGAGAYIDVIPTGEGNALNLRVAYTLVPTDGGDEVIVIQEATAVVPSIYTNWQPNFAYTYIFKITEASGTGDDLLYPITFDACVTGDIDGIQETITEVSKPAITTYQKGKNVTENDEYLAGKNIYVTVEDPADATTISELQMADDWNKTFIALYTAEVEDGALQPITEATADNCFFNGEYNSTDKTYTVTDANGRKLTLTESDKLSIPNPNDIPAADAPHGVKITGTNQIAQIEEPDAKVYVFQYMTDIAKYTKVTAGTTVKKGVSYYQVVQNGNVTEIKTVTAKGNELLADTTYSVAPAVATATTDQTLETGKTYFTKSGDDYTAFKANGAEPFTSDTYYTGTPTAIPNGTVLKSTDVFYKLVGTVYKKQSITSDYTVQPTDAYYTFTPTAVVADNCNFLKAGKPYYKMDGTNIVKFAAKGNEPITADTYYESVTPGTKYTDNTTLTAGETYYTFATDDDPTTKPTGAAADGDEVISDGNYYTFKEPAKYAYKVIRVAQ